MGTAIPFVLAIATLAAGVLWAAPRIEDDVADQVDAALAQAGFATVSTSVDGRDVTITVADPAAADAVRTALDGVDGIRALELIGADGMAVDSTAAAVPVTPGLIVLTIESNRVVIGGTVATAADARTVLTTARGSFDRDAVDQITIDEAVDTIESTSLAARLEDLAPLLAIGIDEAEVRLGDGQLSARGTATSAFGVAGIEAAAAAAGLTTDLQLEAATSTLPGPLGDPGAGTVAIDLVATQVRFVDGSATISVDQLSSIAAIAESAQSRGDLSIVLVGRSAADEDPALAGRRAEAVRTALVRAGMDEARIRLGPPTTGGRSVGITTQVGGLS